MFNKKFPGIIICKNPFIQRIGIAVDCKKFFKKFLLIPLINNFTGTKALQ